MAGRILRASLAVGIAGTALAIGIMWPGRGDRVIPALDLVRVEPSDGRPLWVQRHEVTVAERNACHLDGGCSRELLTSGGRIAAETPATTLNYPDAVEYVSWIGDVTGYSFRLPSAAEWTAFAAGVIPAPPPPLLSDPALDWASAYLLNEASPRALKPRGSFKTTKAGIVDLDGSVWEWTADCAVTARKARCPAFVMGGEHMAVMPYLERDPARGGCAVGTPPPISACGSCRMRIRPGAEIDLPSESSDGRGETVSLFD